MPLFFGDQSKVVLIGESGTYANTSGTGRWIGLVQSNTPDDNMNVIKTRYLGTASRNIGRFDDGPQDYTGTLSYIPQDMRLLGYALGSIVDAGSPSPYTHVLSEINNGSGNAYTSGTITPFLSFTLEDSKTSALAGDNFIKTYKGCVVDNWKLNFSQGELLTVDVDWIAQSVVYSSGATTAVTEDTANTPFKWSQVTLQIPSGTAYPELKTGDFSVSNNFDASNKHYINGSRVIATPSATDRNYAFNGTFDLESARGKVLFDQYFIGGSTFNAILAGNTYAAGAGSQDFIIIMSGCKLTSMDEPTMTSSVQETNITFEPKTIICNVNDLTQMYNPW